MNQYKSQLATYIEQISDDFQSTFTRMGPNVLSNMLGMKGDFENLTRIVQNYIPDAKLKFTKTNNFEAEYDIYLIELETE